MPTMVERLADVLTQVLKLDAIDGADAQAAFTVLDGQIDNGLGAFEAAGSRHAFQVAQRQYGYVFDALGAGVFGLGADLAGDAAVFYLVDQALGGGSLNGATGAQADFAAADTQLFGAGVSLAGFGVDISSLSRVGSPSSLTALQGKLAGDSNTLAGDFSALGTDVEALVNDFDPSLEPGWNRVTNSPPTAANAALGEALFPLQNEFAQIGADFGVLATTFGGPNFVTAAVLSSGGSSATAGSAFAALDSDFLALDKSLQGLATPLANLLLPAVAPTPTT